MLSWLWLETMSLLLETKAYGASGARQRTGFLAGNDYSWCSEYLDKSLGKYVTNCTREYLRSRDDPSPVWMSII